jgi:hypothetical protein
VMLILLVLVVLVVCMWRQITMALACLFFG